MSDNLNKEMKLVIENINRKIARIDENLNEKSIKAAVKDDLELLIEEFVAKKALEHPIDIDFTAFKEKNLPLLRIKKKISLKRARTELENLKNKIQDALGGFNIEPVR